MKGTTFSSSKFTQYMLKAIINTIAALKQCGKDHGRDAVNATLQCIGGVKEEAKTEFCKSINSCKKDSFSDACKKRGKEIQNTLCSCELAKLKEVKKDLEKLQDDNSHDKEEFKGILGEDFEEDKNETLAGIKVCFVDNKEKPPTSLDIVLIGQLIAGHHEYKGPHVVLPLITVAMAFDVAENKFISANEIWFFNALIDNMIKHHECGCD